MSQKCLRHFSKFVGNQLIFLAVMRKNISPNPGLIPRTEPTHPRLTRLGVGILSQWVKVTWEKWWYWPDGSFEIRRFHQLRWVVYPIRLNSWYGKYPIIYMVGLGISEPSTGKKLKGAFRDAWTQQKPESYPMIPLGRSLTRPSLKNWLLWVGLQYMQSYLGFLPVQFRFQQLSSGSRKGTSWCVYYVFFPVNHEIKQSTSTISSPSHITSLKIKMEFQRSKDRSTKDFESVSLSILLLSKSLEIPLQCLFSLMKKLTPNKKRHVKRNSTGDPVKLPPKRWKILMSTPCSFTIPLLVRLQERNIPIWNSD